MNKTEYNSKAELYHKYRWDYSPSAIDYILKTLRVDKSRVLLDIGAGTGKLTKHFTRYIEKIYAVEPDSNMFAILKDELNDVISLKRYSHYMPEIPNNKVDVIVAAHALHWFDFHKTLIELNRISSPPCSLFAIENRNLSDHPLFRDTAELVKKYTNQDILHRQDKKSIGSYFKGSIKEEYFDHTAPMDFDSYFGSLASTSFLPEPSDDDFVNFKSEATTLFQKYTDHPIVDIKIRTTVQYGSLSTLL